MMIWVASKLFRHVNSATVVPNFPSCYLALYRLCQSIIDIPSFWQCITTNYVVCFLINRSTSFLTFLPQQQLLCSWVTTRPILLYVLRLLYHKQNKCYP